MLDSRDIGGLQGAPLHGAGNEKIGNVAQVFVDPETGSPNWVTIKTGFLGRHESFVPLANASWDGEILRTDLDRETVLEAPRLNADEGLSPHNEEALNRYFGLSDVDTDGGTARPAEEYPEHPELMEQAAARQRDEDAAGADAARPGDAPVAGATSAPAHRAADATDHGHSDGDGDVRPADRDATATPVTHNADVDADVRSDDRSRASTPVPYDAADTRAGNGERNDDGADLTPPDPAGQTAGLNAPPRRTGPRHAATRDTTS